jgi:hypothetical protein
LLALLVACESEGSAGGAAGLVTAADLAAWPEVRDCRNSIEHDSNHIRVLASPATKDAYLGTGAFPSGSIVVKPEYADAACTDLVRVTVMRRGEGFDATGGWEWQELAPDLTVVETGALARCWSCHAACDGGHDGACAQP